ncbi:predicted protein [Nematostella vectensis]|uniref:Fork-head domain-containing protein n=1 Tax=Nematostella vectensis TaxID=45351 RepID=A7RPM8_NEMVE|nr:predicted protein [Nematostella vectensis]|eukprot:XP_001638662.1 predicted protein [Nematostella vectensis]
MERAENVKYIHKTKILTTSRLATHLNGRVKGHDRYISPDLATRRVETLQMDHTDPIITSFGFPVPCSVKKNLLDSRPTKSLIHFPDVCDNNSNVSKWNAPHVPCSPSFYIESFNQEGTPKEHQRSCSSSSTSSREDDLFSDGGLARGKAFRIESKPPTNYSKGTVSYSDLLAEAISSSPDKRLTLQEIYMWFEDNVAGISPSSVTHDWKNTIRHTLSRRKRFLRIAMSEKKNKSWWTVNPAFSEINKPALNLQRSRAMRSASDETTSANTKPSLNLRRSRVMATRNNFECTLKRTKSE